MDGVDISLADPAWLRRQIGVVLQENFLFNCSVRDNIAIQYPSATMADIVRVAQLAGAHDFILELPEGYDTMVGEKGTALSGGQRQRIAIARALLMNPRLLIFDEATSALDYESERIIQRNLMKICQGRTVIIIAHRLSTLRHANKIMVIDRGELVEFGSHDDLIRKKGLYHLIFIIIILTVAWSYFGRVNQVAVAMGKVIPDGKVKVIQPMEEGIIRAIHVEEGQWVKEGQTLIELDPTFKQADVESSAKLLSFYKSDKDRLTAELNGGGFGESVLTEPKNTDNISADFLQLQKKFKDAKESEFRAKEDALRLTIAQKENELHKAETNIIYFEKVVPIIRDEGKSLRYLYDNGGLNKIDLYSKQKELYSAEKELETQKVILKQTADSIEEARKNLDILINLRVKSSPNSCSLNKDNI